MDVQAFVFSHEQQDLKQPIIFSSKLKAKNVKIIDINNIAPMF
jgi:hypothetical protein